MSDRPFLSVLVPTLNEVEWVGHCLRAARAALASARVSGEIVVADGGSSDGTVGAVRASTADTLIELDSPGRARQLEAAASRASGRVVWMVHADVLISARTVDELRSSVAAGADAGWAPVEILPEEGASGWALDLVARGINWRTRMFQTATGDQAIFARREVFERVGGVPDQRLMEGHELARRLREAGDVALLRTPVRISGRRWGRGGVVRTTLMMYAVRAGYEAGVSPRRLAACWRRFGAG